MAQKVDRRRGDWQLPLPDDPSDHFSRRLGGAFAVPIVSISTTTTIGSTMP